MLMTRLPLATLALLVSLTGAAVAGGDIQVTDPYARVSSESAISGAVFMVIENQGGAEDRLVAAATDAAERAELHTHKEDANGVMQMIMIEGGVVVPAGGSHAFARGGDHVMLLGLTRGLKQDDVIRLTLTFEVAGEVVVDVPVDNDREPGAGHSP